MNPETGYEEKAIEAKATALVEVAHPSNGTMTLHNL